MPKSTIKVVLGVLLLAILMLGGCCYYLTAPYLTAPVERDFNVTDLFLPLDLFPENWQEVGEIRPMGPNSSIAIGDPDDAYISYKIRQAPTNMAYYYVYNEYNEGIAKRWFDRMLRTEFNNNRVSVEEPWHTPDELSYHSTYADQFHVACFVSHMVKRTFVCEVVAQYEEFGVDFHSVIEPDTLTLEEFNTIVCHIDAVFVARLGLSEEPISCDTIPGQALNLTD